MPTRARLSFSFLTTVLLGALAAGVVLWPQGVGIHRLPFVANVISLRGIFALGLAVLAVIAGRRSRSPRGRSDTSAC